MLGVSLYVDGQPGTVKALSLVVPPSRDAWVVISGWQQLSVCKDSEISLPCMKATHQDTMLARFLIDIGGKRSCNFHFGLMILNWAVTSAYCCIRTIWVTGYLFPLPDTAIAAINCTFWNHWEKLDQGCNVVKKPWRRTTSWFRWGFFSLLWFIRNNSLARPVWPAWKQEIWTGNTKKEWTKECEFSPSN